MKKLLILAITTLTALYGFTQTFPTQADSLICRPKSELVKAAILIQQGEGCKQELKLQVLRITLKDSVISNQNEKITNLYAMFHEKEKEVSAISKDDVLCDKARKKLKRTRITALGLGIALVLAIIL